MKVRTWALNGEEEGETDLPGIEASVESLVALWIDISLVSDGVAGWAGGSLLDIGQLLAWSGHCGRQGRRRRGSWEYMAWLFYSHTAWMNRREG